MINLLENLDVDAMIVCGGDGSLAAARRLASESSLRIVGIPATIDNELPMTETALGVDSALNTLAAPGRRIRQCVWWSPQHHGARSDVPNQR